MNTSQEQYLNPDELLAFGVRQERADILKLQPLKADQAIAHMLVTQARLGDTASNHFVPKDYTKPQYATLKSEPTVMKIESAKKDPYEQALATIGSGKNQLTPEIDADLARMLVERSIDIANTQEKTDAR